MPYPFSPLAYGEEVGVKSRIDASPGAAVRDEECHVEVLAACAAGRGGSRGNRSALSQTGMWCYPCDRLAVCDGGNTSSAQQSFSVNLGCR